MSINRLDLIGHLIDERRLSTQLHSQYLAQNREYLPGENLYLREVHFVMAVGPGEGRSMSELAEMLEVTQGAASQLATRLEKKGYIYRHQTKDDKRQRVATLTENGKVLYDSHILYDRQRFLESEEFFSRFTTSELQMFAEYEKIFRAILTKENERNRR